MHDYELEQLDVKTTFLHGDLEEDIYMEQSDGFIFPGKSVSMQIKEIIIWFETISERVV
jgi:hypothetical protein